MAQRRRESDKTLQSELGIEDDKVDPWIVTYADMMSLLLAFFILLLALGDFDPGKFDEMLKKMSEALGGMEQTTQETVDKTQEVYNELEKLIKDENLTQDVELTSDTRGIVLFAKSGVMFQPGKATLQKDAKYFLNSVGEILKKAPNKILVEGHTDDVPIKTEKFPSNWELSSARAGAIIRYFIEKREITPARCQAVGYAQYKPRFPPIPENRPRNRRVEIILLQKKF